MTTVRRPTEFLGRLLGVITLGATPLFSQQPDSVTRICLAPAAVEAGTGNATAAIDAVREAFTAYLTGPTLETKPLTARLASQAKEEAKQSGCPYLLLPTIKHEQKKGTGGLLGQAAASAARQGAVEAGIASGSAAGRIAGNAAHGAANQAAWNYAYITRNKDELTLGFRLEAADGKVLLEKRDKRKAKADGEDLLTPMVQRAAEQIVAATTGAR